MRKREKIGLYATLVLLVALFADARHNRESNTLLPASVRRKSRVNVPTTPQPSPHELKHLNNSAHAQIRVQIVDSSGEPLTSGRITWTCSGETLVEALDDDGEVMFPHCAANACVVFEHPSAWLIGDTRIFPQQSQVTLRAQRSPELLGIVSARDTNASIADAQLWLVEPSQANAGVLATTTTDAAGEFSLQFPKPADLTAECSASTSATQAIAPEFPKVVLYAWAQAYEVAVLRVDYEHSSQSLSILLTPATQTLRGRTGNFAADHALLRANDFPHETHISTVRLYGDFVFYNLAAKSYSLRLIDNGVVTAEYANLTPGPEVLNF